MHSEIKGHKASYREETVRPATTIPQTSAYRKLVIKSDAGNIGVCSHVAAFRHVRLKLV